MARFSESCEARNWHSVPECGGCDRQKHGGGPAPAARTSAGDLFQRQAGELDKKKREEMVHQMQRILSERVVFAPIWENALIRGVGPKVEEGGLTLIPAFPYSAPLEDVKLKR